MKKITIEDMEVYEDNYFDSRLFDRLYEKVEESLELSDSHYVKGQVVLLVRLEIGVKDD